MILPVFDVIDVLFDDLKFIHFIAVAAATLSSNVVNARLIVAI